VTRDQILKLWPNASESTIRKNLDVCPVAAGQPEQIALRPLDKGVQKRQKGKGGVQVVVSLVTCRCRELDDDGNVAALKPLRDAIAEVLQIDDGDRRIRFEYGQIESRSECGVIVKIERI
jgi:hypothetical protein